VCERERVGLVHRDPKVKHVARCTSDNRLIEALRCCAKSRGKFVGRDGEYNTHNRFKMRILLSVNSHDQRAEGAMAARVMQGAEREGAHKP
jgi:hypothetical protein